MPSSTVLPSALFAAIGLAAATVGSRSLPLLAAQPSPSRFALSDAARHPASVRPAHPVIRRSQSAPLPQDTAAQDTARQDMARQDSVTLYTEAQATAGAEVYTKVCVECHEKSDVTNADFRSNWGGRTLFELFEEIRTTMPDDNPGALSRDEYTGAVAYILQLNGFAAGTTAVMPDSAAMSAAKLEFPPPPPPVR